MAGGSLAEPGPVAERIAKVDHVAIALPSIEAAVPLFCETLGAKFLSGGDNDETHTRLVHLQFPGMKLELLQPLREGSMVDVSLQRHGAGFHHMTFFVDDVLTTVDALTAEGLPTVGTDTGHPDWKETFIRPGSSFGALLQFVETTRDWSVAQEDFGLADVLAGRVVWRDYLPCLRDRPGGSREA